MTQYIDIPVEQVLPRQVGRPSVDLCALVWEGGEGGERSSAEA